MNLLLSLGSIFLFLLSQTLAQSSHQRLISVRGEGAVKVVPDKAAITLSFKTENQSAKRALELITTRMEEARETLLSEIEGLGSEDITTTGNTRFTKEDTTSSYADHYVYDELLVVVDTTLAGHVLDLQLRGKLVGVQYSHSDPAIHVEQARRAATKDAKAKAETIVAELGSVHTLGNAKTVVEAAKFVPASATSILAAASAAATTNTGKNNIFATDHKQQTQFDEASMFTAATSDNTFRVFVDVTFEIAVKGEDTSSNGSTASGGGQQQQQQNTKSKPDSSSAQSTNEENSGSHRGLKQSGGSSWPSRSLGIELALLFGIPFLVQCGFFW